MSTFISLARFVGLLTLVILILSGCNGSGGVSGELKETTAAEEKESQRPSENAVVEPTTLPAEESDQMETKNVLVEIRVPIGLATDDVILLINDEIAVFGFELDTEYQPVPMSPSEEDGAELEAANEEIVVVRGTLSVDKEEELKQHPRVVAVWSDPKIEAFDN